MIDIKKIDKVELPELEVEGSWYRKEYGEHYKLLNYLCSGKELVYDVGTYEGFSAAAMSSAEKVISYDLVAQRLENSYPKNIEFKLGGVLKDKKLLNADLILLDTFHEGPFEKTFLKHLTEANYKGVLVMDDILLSSMAGIWEGIEQRKEDLTSIGHYSGTGIVFYE